MATRLIAGDTTIPIPKIHAHSLESEKGPHGVASFVIMEYVQGQILNNDVWENITQDQRANFYTQLADIYIQLRRLEFPAIGRLARCPKGDGLIVKSPMTKDINFQVVQGLQPLSVVAEYCGKVGALTSAQDYVSMLLDVAWNAFEKARKSVRTEARGCEDVYFLDRFSQFVRTTWLDPSRDDGIFVLSHGDLAMENLVVNDDLDILAVLDWEWSCVVPSQLFLPPTWITNETLADLTWAEFYRDYVKELTAFLSVVRDQELDMFGKEVLSREWEAAHHDAGILVGAALGSWTHISSVAGRSLDGILHRNNVPCDQVEQYKKQHLNDAPRAVDKALEFSARDFKSRIKRFMEQHPNHGALVTRKVAQYAEYEAELQLLGVTDSSDDESEES